jgi:photosystem II stability/assembly factor-like uncharacterized protein
MSSRARLFRGAPVAGALLALLALSSHPAPAQAQARQAVLDDGVFNGLRYRLVGPTRGGRVTAVAGHRAHPSAFYMGPTGGGVWKTEDWGLSWYPIMDDVLETGSIGAIRVAPSDPNVVYVGTGSDGIRSNVIVGRGVYRSDDAGESWRFLGLRESGQIGAVEIHPDDPDVAWVAALGDPFGKNDMRGVFRTRDGGATWDKVLFTSDSVGAIDLEIHPTDPDVLYASMWRGERKPWTIISGMEESAREDGVWRSENGGDTWEYVPLNLPSGLIGKIDFAVSAAAPDRVYAVVETLEPEEGLYRSDDAGRSWRLVSNHGPLMDRPFYYTNVDADPTDADVVYVSATQFWKSTDAGRTWERRNTPHGDNHDLWINPDDPRIMVQSNDGGTNVTRDGGESWSTQLNQPTAELYSVDLDDDFPRWLYAGQQDNTTIRVPSNRPAKSSVTGPEGLWEEVGGCETGPVVPKPGDPDIVYANCKGRFGLYNARTGQEQQYYVGAANMYGTNPAELDYRFQRVVPIEVSPHDPEVVYHGSQYVHRTRDGGVTWERISPDLTAFRPERQMVSGGPITRDGTGEEHFSTLYAIEESPLVEGVIWAGANDGPVHVTRDGGRTWTDVTPPMPADGRIQTIDPSPHEAGRAYVAAYRTLMGDYAPYIFRTDDYGATWTRLTDGRNGIPGDHPTRVVREDPDRPGLLYAGTEFGLFVSFDDGRSWRSLQLNLPATPVTDLKVADQDLYVATMGRSFWILDGLEMLHHAVDGFDPAVAQLFQPLDAYRARGGGGSFGFGDASPIRPEYPGWSVTLDYWVPEGHAGALALEIVNDAGEVLQRWTADGPGVRTTQDQQMRAPVTSRSGQAALSTEPGAHRVAWGFQHEGVMVPPGRYAARLLAGDRAQERSFHLHIDPRVAAAGVTVADLSEQYELSRAIATTMAEAQEVAGRVREGVSRTGSAGEVRRAFESLQARLVDDPVGSYPKPMLLNQLRYLYSMLQRADQKPGRDAYERHEQLKAELAEIRTELERLQGVVTP